MSEPLTKYCIRANFPSEYDGLGTVRWYDVEAKNEKEAFTKVRREAAKRIRLTIVAENNIEKQRHE